MDIERLLKTRLNGNLRLSAPVKEKITFDVEVLDDKVVFLPGYTKKRREVSWESIAKLMQYLMDKDWVEIGAMHGGKVKNGTLESLTDEFGIKEDGVVNYIAAFLKHGDFIEIDNNIPSKVRLIKSSLTDQTIKNERHG